jgi:hypothetical protein
MKHVTNFVQLETVQNAQITWIVLQIPSAMDETHHLLLNLLLLQAVLLLVVSVLISDREVLVVLAVEGVTVIPD